MCANFNGLTLFTIRDNNEKVTKVTKNKFMARKRKRFLHYFTPIYYLLLIIQQRAATDLVRSLFFTDRRVWCSESGDLQHKDYSYTIV
jgi:hypothetical protein